MNPLRSILNKYKKPVYEEGGSLTRGGTDDVQKYQRFLNEKYNAGLVEDGAWGPKTQKAYEKFVLSQKAAAPKTAAPTNAPVTPSKKQAPVVSKPTAKPAAAPVKKESPRFPFENSMLVPRVGQTPVSAPKKVEAKPVQKPVAKATSKPAEKPVVKSATPAKPNMATKWPSLSDLRSAKTVSTPTTVTANKGTNWPSLSDLPKSKVTPKPVAKPVAKPENKPTPQKLNPDNISAPVFGNLLRDRRELPYTGVVVDRGTNEAFVLGENNKYQMPVLTGKNRDSKANKNTYTVEQIDKIGDKAKVTPTGYYIMDSKDVSPSGRIEYNNNIRGLRPITAYNTPKPEAKDLAVHQTYDPAYREQFYTKPAEMRGQSYGCINGRCGDVAKMFRDVADKDTVLVIDSRLPNDKALYNQIRQKVKGNKSKGSSGYKFGGKTSSFKSKLKQAYFNK
jgi:hypothetical protein